MSAQHRDGAKRFFLRRLLNNMLTKNKQFFAVGAPFEEPTRPYPARKNRPDPNRIPTRSTASPCIGYGAFQKVDLRFRQIGRGRHGG